MKRFLLQNYPWLKDIYQYLQSKTKSFPWIDAHAYREEFLKKLGVQS